MKAAIKADISRPENQQEMNNGQEARRQGIALGHYRTQLLVAALQRNVATIRVAKCSQWFRYMQTYLPRCLNREHIEGRVRSIDISLCINDYYKVVIMTVM